MSSILEIIKAVFQEIAGNSQSSVIRRKGGGSLLNISRFGHIAVAESEANRLRKSHWKFRKEVFFNGFHRAEYNY